MTIGNALRFIEQGIEDSLLRERLNHVSTAADLNKVLETEKLIFSPHDFDEAFHSRLVKCQEAEDADRLKEFKMWWDLLQQLLNSGLCRLHCSKC